MVACWASPLTTVHITGISNTMADFASQLFDTFPNASTFLTEFQSCFPLPQQASWICCCLPNATVGYILSMMSMPTSALASWWQLKQHTTVIGDNGLNSFHETSTHTFRNWQNHNDLWSYKFLLKGYGNKSSAKEIKCKLAASKQHLVPLARQSNWLGSPTYSTDMAQQTTMLPLASKWKHTNVATQPQNNKWLSQLPYPTTSSNTPETPTTGSYAPQENLPS